MGESSLLIRQAGRGQVIFSDVCRSQSGIVLSEGGAWFICDVTAAV